MTAPMNPAESPGWYQPTSLPSRVESSAPATPSAMVIKKPPGSLPGIRNLAIAPAMKPMMIIHNRFSMYPPLS